ncbi:uncharacterized protein LOC103388131 [Cynoglossus semilaevis]|uniref:uncharacterized protein LOC103388131 n=1 Tax=Cynoglossus semilaevis TaxID=244447 RepID=UPI000497F2A1|nr:uncharacterized protein LOC103388131 [Cynoglossus semilaevis]
MEIAREPEDPHSDLSKKSCSCGFPSCIVWCRDCSEPLCDTCLAAHRRVTLTKTHQMLDHTPANPSHVGTTLCLQHPSEKLKLYCLTCKQYTCRDCQLSSAHMNHSYQFVTEAVTDMKSQLRTMLQPIRALRHKLKQTLKDLKTRLSDIISGEEKLLAELENSHNYCAKILANRVQFLREQIKNVQKTEMHQVQTNIEKLQQLQVKQLKAEKLLKKSLVVDDLTLLVNLKAQVETEMKSVSEEDVALPALMKEIEVTTNMYAVNALSNLGFIQISDVPFCISTNTSGHETGPAPILPSTLGTKQGSSLVSGLGTSAPLGAHNKMVTNQDPAVAKNLCLLMIQSPASTNQGPAPTNQGPAPTNQGPASTNQGPASTNQGPASTNQGPASTNQGPASTNQGPASTNQGPASTNQGPASTNQGPASTNQGPVSTNQGPASTDQSQAIKKLVQMLMIQGSLAIHQNPRLTNQSPRLTNQSPRLTNQSPRLTNQSPRLTNQSPRLTNQGPHRPIKAQHRPIKAQHRPIKAQHRPIKAQHRPIKAQHRPIKAQHRPIKAQHRPIKAQHRPIKAQHRPIKAQHRPIKAQHRPIKAQHRPIKAQHRPIKAQHRPIKAQHRPIKAQHRPIKAQHRPI